MLTIIIVAMPRIPCINCFFENEYFSSHCSFTGVHLYYNYHNQKTELKLNKSVFIRMDSKHTITQSAGLSERLSNLIQDGRRLNDDSCSSEETLTRAICEITPYIEEKCKSIGAVLTYKKTITLFECQEYFHKVGGPLPDIKNKKVSMKPDGGVFIATINEKSIPILIIEDKVQGTNDNLYVQNKKRQATGNAIERAAKNIRGAEMLFCELDIFPYVMFASGCDFHSTETISKRIEMMNMGFPNHYIGLTPAATPELIDEMLDSILPEIDISKKCGKGIASVFVKAHKWDEMPHGSSLWKQPEIVKICKAVVDKVFTSLVKPDT